MPANVHQEYVEAELKYLKAKTDEERLLALEEMMRTMPKHKSAEALRRNIRTRYKKLKQKLENKKKKKLGKKQGIKKSLMQALIVGMPNTGKSTLFKKLTNQEAKISSYPFTTREPQLGTMNFEDIKIQLIDMPPFPDTEQSLINVANTLLIVIDNLEQLTEINELTKNSSAKKIIIFNKADLLDENEKRKICSTLQTKKYNFFVISNQTPEQELEQLKKEIFKSFGVIRVYTKEPKKEVSKEPVILKQNSQIKELAEKIFKKMPQIKQIKIWGPSSKFSGQIVGPKHVLKDKDIVEFNIK